MKRKNVDVELVDQNANGGRIVINTGAVDRDRDRVLPQGVKLDNYMKNPVVQWGHNYRDPWATVGETLNLEISDGGIVADFSLREPANESDPMHVIRALWEQGLIRTASVGFNPLEWEENEVGGYDFTAWELLEWSLVPVPANQEALRLAVKGLTSPDNTEPVTNKQPERYSDIDFTPPEGVREACRVGIRQIEDGLGGDGLEDATVREARAMARGEDVTAAKARKGYRWWARNERFLEAENDTPADVAANLWGGRAGPGFFNRLYEQMEAADEKDTPQDEVPDAPKSVDSTERNQATNDDLNELAPEELSVLAELTQALKQLKERYDV
jgi:HK97 family phage prohead protease